jgi:hypothetical protein
LEDAGEPHFEFACGITVVDAPPRNARNRRKRNGIKKKEGKQTLSIWRPRADGERKLFRWVKH